MIVIKNSNSLTSVREESIITLHHDISKSQVTIRPLNSEIIKIYDVESVVRCKNDEDWQSVCPEIKELRENLSRAEDEKLRTDWEWRDRVQKTRYYLMRSVAEIDFYKNTLDKIGNLLIGPTGSQLKDNDKFKHLIDKLRTDKEELYKQYQENYGCDPNQ